MRHTALITPSAIATSLSRWSPHDIATARDGELPSVSDYVVNRIHAVLGVFEWGEAHAIAFW